ncbi:hypothetical protein HRbin10_02473 [bacterium HR10]|nr:hypothetical protein HRbin10_02473 [bacterium HR10]
MNRRLAIFILGVALIVPVHCGSSRAPSPLSPDDDAFLEDLSHRAFLFFWEQADPNTGLVRDRAGTNGERRTDIASIAATGFGLTALCIAAERGWISAEQARERARTTLRFLAERAPHENGWFYHWMNARTGAREWASEVSSIDTALLLGGVLAVRQCFDSDAEIVARATTLYERVDFPWMLNGHPTLLAHGWTPEGGFLPFRWDTYSEHMILYLLAIASPTHPISPEAWYAWRRNPITYAGYTYIYGAPPLFIHQYSHAWIDFRSRREERGRRTEWFENSVLATRAHREFCLRLAREFPASYSENVWGITASDCLRNGQVRYCDWGGPPPPGFPRDGRIDGTVVPSAAAGSLMFTPEIALPALRTMRERFSAQYGERFYGRYGFTDAFNPTTGWVNADVIGISVGVTLLSAENLRTGRVWSWFMRNPEIARAMTLIGLRPEP